MLPEPLVLLGHEGVQEVGRHVRQRGGLAVLAAEDRADNPARALALPDRRGVYVGRVCLEGPGRLQLLYALHDPEVPARRERQAADEEYEERDAQGP